jgi:type VI protein secretion system component VasK
MSTIRTLMIIAALTAGSAACQSKADKPAGETAQKAADKASDKPADKAADKPADNAAEKPGDKPVAGSASAPAAPAGSASPVAKTTLSDADAERFYTFIAQLVAVTVANQDDCTKMAAAVNAHLDANKALIKDAATMKQQNKELPAAIREKMGKKFRDELAPAITKKCSKDKAVMDAFQKIKA